MTEHHNPVGQSYLDEHVLAREAAAHIVYVTWPEDTFYPHLMPMFREVAEEAAREVKLVTAPVADTTPFCEKYQVCMVPTIFLFRGGKLTSTLSGFLPKATLKEIIENLTNPTRLETLAIQVERARQALAEGEPAEKIAEILRTEDFE